MLQQGSYSASWFNICLVCALICCGCGRGLAVKASEQSSDHTPYDFFSVSVIAELIKLGFSAIQLGFERKRVASAIEAGDATACLPGEEAGDRAEDQVQLEGWLENAYFIVPGLLFAVSNNAMFIILTKLDPGTLSMIWNLKIVLTAGLLRLAMGRVLNGMQLAGVFLLTTGVLISQSTQAEEAVEDKQVKSGYITGVVLAFGSMCIVCVANVSTEWLYKRTHANQYRQYCRLYSAGVFINLVCMLAHDGSKVVGSTLFDGYNGWTILVIVLSGCHGFVIGMTFKHLDNIVLVFCDVGMMVIITVVSWFVFDLKLDPTFVIGLLLVAVAIYLYYVQGSAHEPSSPSLKYAPVATSEPEHYDGRPIASELENERI